MIRIIHRFVHASTYIPVSTPPRSVKGNAQGKHDLTYYNYINFWGGDPSWARWIEPVSARVLVEIDTRHNLYHYFKMLTSNALRELEKLLGPDRFSARPEDLLLYSYDGTGQSHPPEAVAWR